MLFCFEKLIFFSINPIFLILWEIFLLQSHSAASFLPLGIFEKNRFFFSKNPYTSDEKTRIWTFLEHLFFQSLFTGYYLHLANSKKLNFFFRKPICFFKQPKFCTFWEILLSQSFLRQILPWNFCGSKKTQYFVSKNPTNFFKETIFKARKKFNISVAFCSKVATFDDFLNCEIFSGKPSNFFQQKPLF